MMLCQLVKRHFSYLKYLINLLPELDISRHFVPALIANILQGLGRLAFLANVFELHLYLEILTVSAVF
jgi:hypothetical protein